MPMGKIGVIKSGVVMAGAIFLAACSDDMQLLSDEQSLYGGCQNVYQIIAQGKLQPMIRADAVFTVEKNSDHYITLTKGDDGLEVDMTACDQDSMLAFDEPIEMMEGPAGRVVGKLIR